MPPAGRSCSPALRNSTATGRPFQFSRTRSGEPCFTCSREERSFRRRSSSRRRGEGSG
jgi:hypothetical protein